MMGGVVLGMMVKNRNIGFIEKLITVLIWMLLFILGVEVGGNEEIVSSLSTLGLEAVAFTIAGILGSIVCAWMFYKWIQKGGAA